MAEIRNRIIGHVFIKGRDLQDNEGNFRVHPQAQVDAMSAILQSVGVVDELLVYDSVRYGGRTIIDGHLRKDLHLDVEWPCSLVDLTDDEADTVLATFDYLTSKADVDHARHATLLKQIQERDAALLEGVLGREELSEILALGGLAQEPVADPGPQANRAAELQKKWQVERGQVWEVGQHRVMCGDSACAEDVTRLTGGEELQAIVTDPPYGIDWDTDHTRFSTQYGIRKKFEPIIGDQEPFDPQPYLDYDKVVLCGANWYCQHIPIGTWIVWDKRHPNGTAWLSDAELLWIKGKRGIYIYAETVQGAHRKEHAEHPTQKPVGLMNYAMDKAQIGSDNCVFDPFLGSGTTLVACEQTSRIGYGMEIEPKYVAVTLERLAGMGLEPRLVEQHG